MFLFPPPIAEDILSVYNWTHMQNPELRSDSARIETDPEVLGGRPYIRDTRLSVEFLQGLIARGLKAPRLCIIDGNPGLRRAVERIWPRAAVLELTRFGGG